MILDVDVHSALGAFSIQARFTSSGALTALLGRSGAGKTSLINLVAGLTRPDRGRIAVGEQVLVDTAQGIFLPAHRRRLGYVFQEGRLFPHLTVAQNLTYGRWFQAPGERYARLDDVIGLLGLELLLARRPDGLSGGEKQRVAIGRALLASPRLLLMDEPLASLDDARKAEILPYIERLRDELRIPIVYVSHSVAEVARLATHVVVLAGGRVVAHGATREILSRQDLFPHTGDTDAGAVLDATVAAHDEAFGLTTLRLAAGELHLPHVDLPIGGQLRVHIRARDVLLATTRPEAISAQNILRGTITELRGSADTHIVDTSVDCGGDIVVASITRRAAQALALAPGVEVFVLIKTAAIHGRI